MKSHSLLFFVSSCVASAAVPSLPSFSSTLPSSPLSLLESVKPGQIPRFEEAVKAPPKKFQGPVPKVTRYVSRMPVIEPSHAIDRNMPVIAPRSDIDFAMIVKEPDLESAK